MTRKYPAVLAISDMLKEITEAKLKDLAERIYETGEKEPAEHFLAGLGCVVLRIMMECEPEHRMHALVCWTNTLLQATLEEHDRETQN